MPLSPEAIRAVNAAADSGASVEVPSHEPPRKFFSLDSFNDPNDEAPSKAPLTRVSSDLELECGLFAPSKPAPPLAKAPKAPAAPRRPLQKKTPRQTLPFAFAFAVGCAAVVAAAFWTPAVDVVLPRVALVECTSSDRFEACNVRPPQPACVDEACAVTARALRVGGVFSPVVVSPAPGADASARALTRFLDGHRAWARTRLETSGAVLYRGFDVANATDFEEVATALEAGGQLASSYLGTSPRGEVGSSGRVKTAADLPVWKMVPTHAEISFSVAPPRRLYFYSHVPNSGPGGETPVTDLRAVLEAMDPAVKRRMSRPLRYHRTYFDASTTWPSLLDPSKTKSWQAMFKTSDPAEVVAKAAAEGYEATRLGDGSFRLSHVIGAPTRRHGSDNAEVWHSHQTNIDSVGWAYYAAHQARHLKSLKFTALALAYRAWYGTGLARRVYLALGSDVGQRVADATTGQEPAFEDMEYVRALMDRFTSTHKHEAGDVLALDNFRVGHARNSWDGGPRQLWAAWSDV